MPVLQGAACTAYNKIRRMAMGAMMSKRGTKGECPEDSYASLEHWSVHMRVLQLSTKQE